MGIGCAKKDLKDKLGLVLGFFIVVIIGVVLLDSLGDSIYAATTLSSATEEVLTTVSGIGTTAQDDLTSISMFRNASEDFTSQVNLGWNWTRAGVITTNSSDGTYNITYGFEGDEYVTNTTAQTLLDLIILFFVLAILILGFKFVKENFEDLF